MSSGTHPQYIHQNCFILVVLKCLHYTTFSREFIHSSYFASPLAGLDWKSIGNSGGCRTNLFINFMCCPSYLCNFYPALHHTSDPQEKVIKQDNPSPIEYENNNMFINMMSTPPPDVQTQTPLITLPLLMLVGASGCWSPTASPGGRHSTAEEPPP